MAVRSKPCRYVEASISMALTVEEKIRNLAAEYAEQLEERIGQRVEEMKDDDM